MSTIEDTRVGFRVVVQRVRVSNGETPSDSKESERSFWAAFPTKPLGAYERSVIERFGPSLQRAAPRYRRLRAAERGAEPEAAPAIVFAFQVTALRYASLELSVAILGLPALVRYFFDDPAIVAEFLELCAAEAFFDAIEQPQSSLPGLNVYVEPAPALLSPARAAQTRTAPGGPAQPTRLQSTLMTLQRVWWLLPTILALITLYVAYAGLHSELGRLSAREASLNTREIQLLALHTARTTALESLTLELVKQTRASTPAADPAQQCGRRCCTHCTHRSPKPMPPAAAASSPCR